MKNRLAVFLAVALCACAVFSVVDYTTPAQKQQLIDSLRSVASSLESFVQYVQRATVHFIIPPPRTQRKK